MFSVSMFPLNKPSLAWETSRVVTLVGTLVTCEWAFSW